MKRTAILVAALALAAAGCSKSSNPSSSPSGATGSNGEIQLTATLAHVPVGSLTLLWTAKTKSLVLKGILTGLAPNSTHPMHIHAGSCEQQGGVIHPLPNLVANGTGVAIFNDKLTLKTAVPAKGWYVNVHTGPTIVNAQQFRPIACVDLAPLPARSGTQEFSKAFSALPGLGNNASGSAKITYSTTSKTLTVVLTLKGLDPNSLHASHIHSGSCAAQGKVVYPLKNVKADSKGNATVTTTLQNVDAPTGPLYVNVHNTTNLATQIGFTPVACGDVNP
ncbi:MAG: CHRD domain-containing protein [Actinomycetota bacterium]